MNLGAHWPDSLTSSGCYSMRGSTLKNQGEQFLGKHQRLTYGFYTNVHLYTHICTHINMHAYMCGTSALITHARAHTAYYSNVFN